MLKLHDYQLEAVEHCIKNKSSMVLGSIGSGKTLIALELIRQLKCRLLINKSLIVAPPKVVMNTYPKELEKWDNFRNLSCKILHGRKKERLIHHEADIYIISYNSIEWVFDTSPYDFDFMILDESHYIKSHKTKRFKKLKDYTVDIPRKMTMTGSPIGNSLQDLWSQYFILDRGERLFKNWTTFLHYWFLPPFNGNVNHLSSWKPKRGARYDITKRAADITYEIPASKVALPELKENIIKIKLTRELQNQYDELKKEAILELENTTVVTAFDAGALIQKVRQFACGFIYTKEKKAIPVHNLKIIALEKHLAEAGNKIMIIANFKEEFAMLKRHFPKIECIRGGVSNSKVNKIIDSWNSGELDLLAVHPKSGGIGLNLQGGGYRQIWLSPDWSQLDRDQTIGRIYRQGQDSSIVIIDSFIVENTIEELIMSTITRKIATVRGFVKELRKHWNIS